MQKTRKDDKSNYVIFKDNLVYKFLHVITFLLSIGSQEGIHERVLVLENGNILPNIKGNSK